MLVVIFKRYRINSRYIDVYKGNFFKNGFIYYDNGVQEVIWYIVCKLNDERKKEIR